MTSLATRLLPALVLAGGILAGTAVAASAPSSAATAMGGALVLAASILTVGELVRRRADAPRGMRLASIVLGAGVVLATGLVAASDAGRAAELLPLLGTSAVVLVLDDRGARARCALRTESRA